MTKEMTEAEMLEELKTWDDEVWKRYKQANYEVIELSFNIESLDNE